MVDTLARVDVKRALPDGRRKLVMTGVELLEKLVPLIPDVRQPHAIHHRQVMNECTARRLRADEPLARQGRPPSTVDER
jgi:hypothetical protein